MADHNGETARFLYASAARLRAVAARLAGFEAQQLAQLAAEIEAHALALARRGPPEGADGGSDGDGNAPAAR